jgi:AcrR family transcriptional regulator
MSDEAQRNAITRVAWDLFLKQGFARTAMAEVAAATHMSLSTIYRFFPGKNELFAAVVSLHRESMLALPGNYDDMPLVDALLHIFQIDIDPVADQQRHALMTMFIAESHRIPELAPILMQQGPLQAHALLVEWLDRQQVNGRIGTISSDITAKMLMDIAFGAPGLKDGTGPQWPGGDNRLTYLRQCFTTLIEGLRPR